MIRPIRSGSGLSLGGVLLGLLAAAHPVAGAEPEAEAASPRRVEVGSISLVLPAGFHTVAAKACPKGSGPLSCPIRLDEQSVRVEPHLFVHGSVQEPDASLFVVRMLPVEEGEALAVGDLTRLEARFNEAQAHVAKDVDLRVERRRVPGGLAEGLEILSLPRQGGGQSHATRTYILPGQGHELTVLTLAQAGNLFEPADRIWERLLASIRPLNGRPSLQQWFRMGAIALGGLFGLLILAYIARRLRGPALANVRFKVSGKGERGAASTSVRRVLDGLPVYRGASAGQPSFRGDLGASHLPGLRSTLPPSGRWERAEATLPQPSHAPKR